jgi:ABC-type dipeptide/oligopeptide/nickel transport system permease subunit
MKRGREPLLWAGGVFLVLLLLFAAIGPSMHNNFRDPVGAKFQYPSAHAWLGTDEIGRDLFARLAYGARISLFIGFTVQLISLTLGIVVGSLGIYAPKWIASPLLRLTDAMFAFPDILLAILIIAVFGRGTFPVIVALAVTAWPAIARLVRSQLATLKDREFVVASRAMGAPTIYTVVKHVLPQLWGILLAVTMVELAATILAESTLSFLGIGVQAPTPSWGIMINTARSYMQPGSHYNGSPEMLYLVWSCVLLALTIFSLNFVGDGLRAILDPKSGKN